jgi:hypothetical protein
MLPLGVWKSSALDRSTTLHVPRRSRAERRVEDVVVDVAASEARKTTAPPSSSGCPPSPGGGAAAEPIVEFPVFGERRIDLAGEIVTISAPRLRTAPAASITSARKWFPECKRGGGLHELACHLSTDPEMCKVLRDRERAHVRRAHLPHSGRRKNSGSKRR